MGYFLSYPADKPGVIRCRTNHPSQRIKELDKERATLFEQAKDEALQRATQAVEDLNALGLHYRLVTGIAADGNKTAAKKPKETGLAVADKKRPAR